MLDVMYYAEDDAIWFLVGFQSPFFLELNDFCVHKAMTIKNVANASAFLLLRYHTVPPY